MCDLVQLIKQCALEATEAAKPVELMLGRVTQEEDAEKKIPLQITLQQKAVIERDFLFDTDSTYGLMEGDRLLLLRQRGGQRYLILARLKGDEDNDA